MFEGINDIRHGGGPAPLPGRNADDMQAGYRQIAARAAASVVAALTGTRANDLYRALTGRDPRE